MDVTVTDAPEHGRFEAWTPDGTLAGLAVYTLREGAIVFTHTEVAAQFEGHGVAAQVVRFALDSARNRSLRVVALCPYVRSYMHTHEAEYGDLVGPPQHPAGA